MANILTDANTSGPMWSYLDVERKPQGPFPVSYLCGMWK